MRMWLVDPTKMCRQHLLGEHLELHMFATTIKQGKSIKGYVNKNLVDTSKIQLRHEELVAEMVRRGYNHKSPLVYEDSLNIGIVSSKNSLEELRNRCETCKAIQEGYEVADRKNNI